MALESGGSLRDVRLLLVCLSLLFAVILGTAVLLSVVTPVGAQEDPPQEDPNCEDRERPQVPGVQRQDADWCPDLTTRTLGPDHTQPDDWAGLHALETENPAGTESIPGIQIDGYFRDASKTNCYNSEDGFPCHDSQFVIRLPDDWNGKLVITGAPGVRKQFSLDFIISDFVLSRGYAFASIDKGNTGQSFYDDGSKPGGSVAEWHRRVEQLTRAAKDTVERRYGKRPDYTYMTGISNGGYLTRHAIENNPELYDGSVDWEGVLWRRNWPNLFTHLPPALRNHEECYASAPSFDNEYCERMYQAGYEPGSEFLWPQHYGVYWDLTQRIYREEFDPRWDGAQKAGTPFCQEDPEEEQTREERCDAEYRYETRPDRVKDAVQKVSLTGKIGKPMLTLHGTLDSLLPIGPHSTHYRQLIENQRKGGMHRYYRIEDGNHVDSYYDEYPRVGPTALRPILPCYWAAFVELEEWVEGTDEPGQSKEPPPSKLVSNPQSGNEANNCSLSQEATYSPPLVQP